MAQSWGIHIAENYGLNVQRSYCCSFEDHKVHQTSPSEIVQWNSFRKFFMQVFLPHGYPESVSKDYFNYQIWDSVQAFASSVNGSIATHALLKGVGVGDETATTLAATISWLTRDGFSMVGRILFSWLKGTQLDSDCKKWRLFADVLNDSAMFLDLMSAHFKGYYMLIICVSGLFKSVVGVAGSATRAALTQHQARRNNMADVSAKDGSQETLVNLAALICSLVLIPIITQNSTLVWLLYFSMTAVHLMANYQAINSVKMNTLNVARFVLCFESYLESEMESVCSVDKANKRESLSFLPHRQSVKINIGSSFHNATKELDCNKMSLINAYRKWENFIVTCELNGQHRKIHICLHQRSTQTDQIKSLFHSCCLKQLMMLDMMKDADHVQLKQNYLWELYNRKDPDDDDIRLHLLAKTFTNKHFEDFKQKCQQTGWNMDIALFDADSWRLSWD